MIVQPYAAFRPKSLSTKGSLCLPICLIIGSLLGLGVVHDSLRNLNPQGMFATGELVAQSSVGLQIQILTRNTAWVSSHSANTCSQFGCALH